MTDNQQAKIDFILNKGKEKSLLFRAALFWHELQPLYKWTTTAMVASFVFFTSILSLNIFAGIGALVFGSVGLFSLERLGQSVVDSMCESVIYDTVESRIEIMTEEDFKNDPAVKAQNGRLAELDIEGTIKAAKQNNKVHAQDIAQLKAENAAYIARHEALERKETDAATKQNRNTLFWHGRQLDQQLVEEVRQELGL